MASFFDFFGSPAELGRHSNYGYPFAQHQQPVRYRNTVPSRHYYQDEDEEDEEVFPHIHREQPRQRPLPNPPSRLPLRKHQHPKQPTHPQQVPITPTKPTTEVPIERQQAKPPKRVPSPSVEQKRQKLLERQNLAANQIQKVFRGHQVREALGKLRQLEEVEQRVQAIQQKYQSLFTPVDNQEQDIDTLSELSQVTSLLDNKRKEHRGILGFEEDLTRQLFSLDAIPSGKWDFVRDRRKTIVKEINHLLESPESRKQQTLKEIKQLEEKLAQLKAAEEEKQTSLPTFPTPTPSQMDTEQTPTSSPEIGPMDPLPEATINDETPQSASPSPPSPVLESVSTKALDSRFQDLTRTINEKDQEIEYLREQLELERRQRKEDHNKFSQKVSSLAEYITELQNQLKSKPSDPEPAPFRNQPPTRITIQ